MKFRWMDLALADLENIYDYIAQDNPNAAAKVVQTIFDYAERHVPSRPGRVGRVTGTFEIIVPKLPYIIVYRPSADVAEILRIYHTSRLWPDSF